MHNDDNNDGGRATDMGVNGNCSLQIRYRNESRAG